MRDLNAAPDGWALASGSVDAVLVCVSVQVLQNRRLQKASIRKDQKSKQDTPGVSNVC